MTAFRFAPMLYYKFSCPFLVLKASVNFFFFFSLICSFFYSYI